MIQGKIERWHQTVKNRILLENYYLPGDLENQIETFVADYNNCRYHESIDNLIPADVYFGRGQTILRSEIRPAGIKQFRSLGGRPLVLTFPLVRLELAAVQVLIHLETSANAARYSPGMGIACAGAWA
jgi:hypothetical protein